MIVASKISKLRKCAELRLYTEEGQQDTKAKRLRALRSGTNALPRGQDVPLPYTSNSEKEALVLVYVKDFQRQLELLQQPNEKHGNLLIARNEYDVPKFICSYICPTLLPTKELQDYASAADFVANLLSYEPTEDACRPPECIASSTQVLQWGVGDAFDFAILLLSYLVGSGYDAYIAYGTAAAHITFRDQAMTGCPPLDSIVGEAHKPTEILPDATRILQVGLRKKGLGDLTVQETLAGGGMEEARDEHRVQRSRVRPCLESQYLKDLEDAKHRGPPPLDPYEDDRGTDPAQQISEVEAADPWRARRVHAWILIRAGRRHVNTPFFLEPTTGRSYTIDTSPYYTIRALWNHRNYWVNMQPETSVSTLSYNLDDTRTWEYVFIDPFSQAVKTHTLQSIKAILDTERDGKDTNGIPDTIKMELEENILNQPTSWVRPSEIRRDLLKLRYPPDGYRMVLFHKAKLERYAENVHHEGLVARITDYIDPTRSIVSQRREIYRNRVDRLYLREHWPSEHKIRECFAPGRSASLSEWTEWLGRKRLSRYYVEGRFDGLVERQEQIGCKIVEHYTGRSDHLTCRTVHVVPSKGVTNKAHFMIQDVRPGNEMIITKMSERFSRDPTIDAHNNIAKRTFYITEGRVRTVFQYLEGRVTRKAVVVNKERTASGSGETENPEETLDHSDEALQHAFMDEKECYAAIRHSQVELARLVDQRWREELDVKLQPPIYERVIDLTPDQERMDVTAFDETMQQFRVDYLTPFLASVKDPLNLSNEEARHVKDNCLKAFKERLMERANIIQTRLKDETSALSKVQANFQRLQHSSDEVLEEYGRQCSEAMFRIQILDNRLNAHADAAVKRYEELAIRLDNDPRLTKALK